MTFQCRLLRLSAPLGTAGPFGQVRPTRIRPARSAAGKSVFPGRQPDSSGDARSRIPNATGIQLTAAAPEDRQGSIAMIGPIGSPILSVRARSGASESRAASGHGVVRAICKGTCNRTQTVEPPHHGRESATRRPDAAAFAGNPIAVIGVECHHAGEDQRTPLVDDNDEALRSAAYVMTNDSPALAPARAEQGAHAASVVAAETARPGG